MTDRATSSPSSSWLSDGLQNDAIRVRGSPCPPHPRTLACVPEHGSLSLPDDQSVKLLGPLILSVSSNRQRRVSKLLFRKRENDVRTAVTLQKFVNEYEISTIGR